LVCVLSVKLESAENVDRSPRSSSGTAGVESAEVEDAELVRALVDGEIGAWDLFVERYSGLVGAVVRRILRGRGLRPGDSDVDDLVENVFVALLERDGRLLRRYDPQHKLATYLGVIARTQCHRWLRAKKAKADLPDEMWGESLADSEQLPAPVGLARAEAIDAVREGLAELTDREQELLKAFYFDGQDYKELADKLQMSINSVGAALTRARARLEAAMKRRSDLTDSDYRSV
jgi:RNA polymerase sigma-70 factor (ECF subfamily)